ncbi:MAG: SPOR domain-containing protein [Firmicutes bacterium]|nr:SPOR domain-containing protein [Bacillota bacterium]
MPERKTRTKEQSIWLVLVWVVTLAAMVGLGVLLGKYVLSYCASSLQTPRPGQTLTTESTPADSNSSQSGAMPASPISPELQKAPSTTQLKEPDAAIRGTTETASGTGEVTGESVFYKVQVGEFYERGEADRVGRVLEEAGYPIFITPGIPHRIQVGAFQNKANADSLAKELEAQGYSVIIQR